MFGQETVTDEITIPKLGQTSPNYTSFNDKKLNSDAIYAGKISASSSTGYIQIKSSEKAGICTTTSGGTVKSITITFNAGSNTSRKIAVFGSTTSYNAISDLYTSSTAGTQIGTDLARTSTQSEFTLTPTEKYSYVGIKAISSSAIKIDKITIVWEVASTNPATETTLSFGADYDDKTITKKVGETFTAAATLTPAVEGADIKYVSSAPTVASVDENGKVTVNAVGTAIISASFAGNNDYAKSEKSYTINAIDPSITATSITFPKTSYTYQYGEENGVAIIENVATISPEAAGELTYTITNPEGIEIASLDKDRTTVVVDTKKVGTATVTASFAGNGNYSASSASYTITVEDNRKTPTLTFAQQTYTFDLGTTVDDFTNALTVDPVEAGTAGVTYESDKEWALVDEKSGLVVVSTDAEGTATITATYAENDNYKTATATYTIVVKKAAVAQDGVFDFTQTEINYGSNVTPTANEKYEKTTKWVAGNVTLTTSSSEESLTKASYGVRWYNASTPYLGFYSGSSFEFSVPEDYYITKMVFTGDITSNVDQPKQGTLDNKTWTGCSNKVSFVTNHTSKGKKMQTVNVTYAKCETLTTAASGFATYAAAYPVNYSALGLTAYAVKLNAEETKVTYTACTGVVPADKAVLVQGEASKEYTLTPATDAEAAFDTDLQASDGNAKSDGSKMYAFSTKDEKSGFYLVSADVTIPAKKGYLQLKGTTGEAKPFFSFDGGSGTTGIAGVEADGETNWDNAVIYNLAGQRVSKSYKGVVIVNGKKMLRK